LQTVRIIVILHLHWNIIVVAIIVYLTNESKHTACCKTMKKENTINTSENVVV